MEGCVFYLYLEDKKNDAFRRVKDDAFRRVFYLPLEDKK